MPLFDAESIYIGSTSLEAPSNKNVLFELKCLWSNLTDEEQQQTIDELTNNTATSGVNLYYSLSLFNNLKDRDQFQTSQLNKGIDRTKSEKMCPKCRKYNLFFRETQTRSGDEGMSVTEECTTPACGYKKFYA